MFEGGEILKNNLRIFMAREKINVSELSQATGISRSTISKFYNEKNKRIDSNTIESICDYFKCSVGDLLNVD